jgi:hypothetical protein
MRHTSRLANRSTRQRRKLVWADTNFASLAAAAKVGVDLLAGYRATAGAVTAGATVMAVNLQLASTWVGTATSGNGLQIGLYMDDAAEVVANLDSPGPQPYSDWMLNYMIWSQIGAAPGPLNPDDVSWRVKSKRKVDEVGRTLWFVGAPFLVGATSVNVQLHARVLLALP